MFFFNQVMLFAVSVFLIVTYSLNLGALSEAGYLVRLQQPAEVEMILSSVVVAVASIALVSIFFEIPFVSMILTRQFFVYLFSLLLIVTYSLNINLLNTGRSTGLQGTGIELSAVILAIALVVFMVMTVEVVRHYRSGGKIGDLMTHGKPLWSFHVPFASKDPNEGGPVTKTKTPQQMLADIESS